MKRPLFLGLILAPGLLFRPVWAENFMVYTAHQNFLSRIYLLRMNGSVQNYFEYDFCRFADVEVVDNQLYVAEAFAPRVYRVDIQTGALQTVIDDWSLYYFYGLAFDGAYFYLDEWDMNRYDINGVKDGTASFDETVFGCAWDGSYLWTLNDASSIRAWDIATWPVINPAPVQDISPPSDRCRGLWYDGEYFWSAESAEGVDRIAELVE